MESEDVDGQVLEFPNYSSTLLEHLNKHRLEGKFCDIHVHVQHCTFNAHKAVLAASSPYFHDQLLLKDSARLLLPDLLDPVVFERVLVSAYTGRLFLSLEDIGSYLTVASFLQMWHVVDKCNEFLRRGCHITRTQSSRSSDTQSPSSSSFFSSREVGDTWVSDHSRLEVSVREKVEVTPENSQQSVEEKVFSDSAVCARVQEGVSQSDLCSLIGGTSSQIHSAPCVKQEGLVVNLLESSTKKEAPLMVSGHVNQLMSIAETQTLSSMDFIVGLGKTHNVQSSYYGPTEPSMAGEADDSMTTMNLPLGHLPHGPVEHTSRFGKKVFACLCGKRFPEKRRRDRHVILRISMRPFACSLCNKKFKLKHHLGEHMLVHTDRPLHECKTCGKTFKLYECFQRHRENCEKLNSSCDTANGQ
ncbi:zinc finger and BTB domain-containing protein 43-like [Pleurodeles waltl]|uniref:zinc finger and BTB domain-containing protein 43-like n=1 Tax=Pleurodeles waltl TaxID=8319 RepID=UPI00370997A2